MARLDEAAERLQDALTQLESIIDARRGADGTHDKALDDALAEAQQRNAELRRIAVEVSDGLDSAVGRLNGLMEG